MLDEITTEKDVLTKIAFGVSLGVARALYDHKKKGQSIVIWKNGKIVKIPPEEIPIPKEFEDYLKNE